MSVRVIDNQKYEPHSSTYVAIGIVIMLGMLIMVHQILRHLPLFSGLVLMGIIPILLGVFYWRKIADWSWFLWVKTYSVSFLCCALLIGKYTEGFLLTAIGAFIYTLIMINVLEASLKDFLKGSKLNSIAGILIAVSTPVCHELSSNAAQTDLFYHVPLIWIFAYTIWNMTFIYGEGAEILGQHLALLTAAIAIALYYGPAVWVQARVLTLGSYFLVYNSNRPWFKLCFVTSSWRSERAYKTMQSASIIVTLMAVVIRFFPFSFLTNS